MSEDILAMMAKAKASKKKVAKKKAVKKVVKKVDQEVIRIPDKPKVKIKAVKALEIDQDVTIVHAALKKYGRESDIPITHAYWRCLNNIRAKMRENE